MLSVKLARWALHSGLHSSQLRPHANKPVLIHIPGFLGSRSSRGQGSLRLYHVDQTYYNYTSGRWLYNEDRRFSERQLFFDVDTLCQIVATSADRSINDIVSFTKIAEGGSYRVFEIQFEGGLSLIARLPYPITVPRKYGLASEVAVMRYVQLYGIPVPKILDWSTDPSNPLGTEYMIMEKAPGIELECVWYSMTSNQRKLVMKNIVDLESKLFRLRFPANGSLYLKESLPRSVAHVDLPPGTGLVGVSRFCIGPSTEYLWWYNMRNELGAHGGPC